MDSRSSFDLRTRKNQSWTSRGSTYVRLRTKSWPWSVKVVNATAEVVCEDPDYCGDGCEDTGSTQTAPSWKNSFFQIGTRVLRVSMM